MITFHEFAKQFAKKITSFMEYEEGQEGDFLFFQALHFSTFSFYLFIYF